MRSIALVFGIACALVVTSPKSHACAPALKKGEMRALDFNPAQSLVFMGSSSIDNWKSLQDDFTGFHTVNLGVGGTKYSDVAASAHGCALMFPAKHFVLYSGENDISTRGTPAPVDAIVIDFLSAASGIHRAIPDASIYVFSIKPSAQVTDSSKRALNEALLRTIKRLNQGAAAAGKAPYLHYIDIDTPMSQSKDNLFLPDGIHMTRAGYEIWIDALRIHLKEAH
jgi:lysophospholipase L1-like esterase